MAILLVVLCVVVLILVLIAVLPRRPRLAILNGTSLDFLPDGHSTYQTFQRSEEGSHNLLFTQTRPIVEREVTPATIGDVCTELYRRGVRMFTGILESALLMPLIPFATAHPDAVIVSASSTVPRKGLLPPNIFRLMASDSVLVEHMKTTIPATFGRDITTLKVVNGSPGNVWADSMVALIQGILSDDFTVSTTLTSGEQGGTPSPNTVYVYMGDREAFTLASTMTGADILVVSGTGWPFEITEGNDFMARNRVHSIDTVNSIKAMQTATLRVGSLSPFLGSLLQSIRMLISVDNLWDGREDLTRLLEVTYGTSLMFTPSHDGNIEGLFVQRMRATSCSDCGLFDSIANAFSDAVTFVVNVVTESDVVSCGVQAVTCASALGSAAAQNMNHDDLIRACKPLVVPFDGGGACISAATGVSRECFDNMQLCVNESNCNPALQVCTTDLVIKGAKPFFNRVIPWSVFSFLY